MSHEAPDPAPFLLEQLDRIPKRGRPLLDLAAGRGRNAHEAAGRGWRVVAFDRDPDALRASRTEGVDAARVDLEAGTGIPLISGSCDGILVFRFLFRPLAPEIERVLAPGGVVVYETFTVEQRELGYGPKSERFLLRPGELPTLFPGLEVLHSEEGRYAQPRPQATARLVARKPEAAGS